MATWGDQDTLINQAELQCGALLASTFADVLRGRDLIWFIDNTSAATALVKAGSPTVSMNNLALKASAMLAALGCRTWYEHVPSDDNPADVLSRDAMEDPVVKQMVEQGRWVFRQPVCPKAIEHESFEALWCAAGVVAV